MKGTEANQSKGLDTLPSRETGGPYEVGSYHFFSSVS